jgi:hypothetical protein
MKKSLLPICVLLCAVHLPHAASAAEAVTSELSVTNGIAVLKLRSQLSMPVSALTAEFNVTRSTDMIHWESAGPDVSGSPGLSEESITLAFEATNGLGVFRVLARKKMAPEDERLGQAIYGFNAEFSRRLREIGQLSLADFQSMYPPGSFLPQLTFEPSSADYWNNFATGLNSEELPRFQTNGFVISHRLGAYSFARVFYNIFTADLPVYISPDAILHAWHRSYVNMLEELEESSLSPALEKVLLGMRNQVSTLHTQSAGTPLQEGVLDADVFIAVANSLLTGKIQYGFYSLEDQVTPILAAISNLQPATITLFGTNRQVDFSQFHVRGHYEASQRLARYFRAMMWCGLADFRFTGMTNDNSLRELSGAVAMHFLLKNSGQSAAWKQMDDIIQMFVGPPDCLNFSQLSDLLAAAGVSSPGSIGSTAILEYLRKRIMSGSLGVQNIQGGLAWSPLGPQQLRLPRSFAVMSRRFAVDAWAMNQCVYDRIWWDENGIPEDCDKVMRRVPSAIDVAFSVFGNNATSPLITQRILNTSGVDWRDGYPYQHNLAAVRQVVDLQQAAAWTNNIYQCWLACLRELSQPTLTPEYPDILRTRPWAMKTLSTQLASWTQLRHDTVLYAKQAYTANVLCSYPAGFVEPRVNFWTSMRTMALRARSLLSTLPKTGTFVFEPNTPWDSPLTNSLGTIWTNRVRFLDNFASNMTTLCEISTKELARQPLSSNEEFFIKSLIEDPHGYGGTPKYSGWYPTLFYENTRAAYSGMFSVVDMWDPLVTDVHTDPLDPIVGDPGCILHQAVGNVGLLIGAVNWAPDDACIYAGPVFSYYEFQLGPTTRRTDSEWKDSLKAGDFPPLPEWTTDFTVPGNISYPNPF